MSPAGLLAEDVLLTFTILSAAVSFMVAEQFGESMGKRRDGGSEGMEAITRAAKIGRTAGTLLPLLHYNDFVSNLHRALWINVSGTISDQSKYTHSYVSPLL